MNNLIPGKRVYIAGPMSGWPNMNFPEFFRVEAALTDLGYDVVNPARNDGGDSWEEAYELTTSHEREWEAYMRHDIAMLLTCDYVCLLDGWWSSRGANCEQTIAAWLRMPFLYPDGTPMATQRMGVI